MKNWHYFTFPEDFDPAELTDRQRGLILAVLRTLAGENSRNVLPDAAMIDAAVELIRGGFIQVYVRVRKGRVETKIEFPLGGHGMPGAMH